jgi:hypothetical protein
LNISRFEGEGARDWDRFVREVDRWGRRQGELRKALVAQELHLTLVGELLFHLCLVKLDLLIVLEEPEIVAKAPCYY